MQLKGKQILGLVLVLAFVIGIFAFGTGGYQAVRKDSVLFTEEMLSAEVKAYNEQERAAVAKDLAVVRNICFAAQHVAKGLRHQPTYIGTVGAAQQSLILEQFMGSHPETKQAVHLDPDERGLKFMAHTVAHQTDGGYEKWKPASNYITHTLLEEAFEKKLDIVHATTSREVNVPLFLKKIHNGGYQIKLLVSSEDGSYKQQMPAYFTYGDILYFYNQEKLAATLERGQLSVHDQEAFDGFVTQYEADRLAVKTEGQQLPSWNELVEMHRLAKN